MNKFKIFVTRPVINLNLLLTNQEFISSVSPTNLLIMRPSILMSMLVTSLTSSNMPKMVMPLILNRFVCSYLFLLL